jgi:hypothetical protein
MTTVRRNCGKMGLNLSRFYYFRARIVTTAKTNSVDSKKSYDFLAHMVYSQAPEACFAFAT